MGGGGHVTTIDDIAPDVGGLYRQRATGEVMTLVAVHRGVAFLGGGARSWHGDLWHFWAEFIHADAGQSG